MSATGLMSLVVTTSGVLTLLLATLVWLLVPPSAGQQRAARLWLLGGLADGCGLLLADWPGPLHTTLAHGLAPVLLLLALYLQALALRHHARLQPHAGRLLALMLAAALVGVLGHDHGASQGGAPGPVLLLLLGTAHGGFCAQALQAWRRCRAAGTLGLAAASALAAAALWLQGLAVALADGLAAVPAAGLRWHDGLLMLALLPTLWLRASGLLLVSLDHARLSLQQAQAGQQQSARQRQAAQQQQAVLQQRLAAHSQRDDEAERLLHLLAHEVRQPLHNASGTLQSAHALLLPPGTAGGPAPAQPGAAAQALEQAQAVLSALHAVLDNMLAEATVLRRATLPQRQELDIDFLVALALGDLAPGEQRQVSVLRLTRLEAVDAEPGLLRLALRNLLRNALAHGGPAVAVTLCVDEYDTPPALVLSVIDDGPGLPPVAPVPSRGRGLRVARRVAELHGGELVLENHAPRGLRANLVLPLPDAVDALDTGLAPGPRA